jgi:hypothetical protein
VDGESELATVEMLGALAYGQLRSFEAAARAVRHAPQVRTADVLAALSVGEHAAYTALRDHLAIRTDLATAVMERQKLHFDAYFDRLPLDDWFGACTFFATGLPIAADFGRALAPTLAPETAQVVVASLADREPFEAFAMEQLAVLLVDDGSRERARHIAADVLGRALTSFQGVIADTDALKVLVAVDAEEAGISGEARVKRLAISVLEGHRRRIVALGLEDLDGL